MLVSRHSAAALVAVGFFSYSCSGQEIASEKGTVGAAPSFAAASAPVQELRRSLLEKRWEYSKQNREEAAAEYAAIRASGEATPADDLLYGIVRFRQHEYAPSAEALNAALAAMPDDRMTLKTRIWTAVERKEFAVVWPLLSRFQRTVFDRAKDPAMSSATKREDLVFLGQLHGYLSGPYGELEDDRLLLSLRDEIAMNLALEDLSVFESAERGVEERQQTLSRKFEALLAEAAERERAEAEAKLAELMARQDDLKAEKEDLAPARDKIIEGARDPLGALTEAEALVATSAESISREAENLRREHNTAVQTYLMQQEILDDLLDRQENQPGSNVFGVQAILANLASLRANVLRIEQQMQALQQQHAGVAFQFEQIRRRRLTEEAELMRTLGELQFDSAKLEKELALLKEEADELSQSKRSNSPVVRKAEKDLSSMASYVDFSLETPRAAALAALGER